MIYFLSRIQQFWQIAEDLYHFWILKVIIVGPIMLKLGASILLVLKINYSDAGTGGRGATND